MAEPQVCRFGGQTHVGPRKRVLDGVQIPPREGALLGSGDAAFCQITDHMCSENHAINWDGVEVIAGNRTKLADSQERQYGSDRAAT